MLSALEPLPVWYVAFVDGEKAWWWRFVRPGFRHVIAFAWQERAKAWLIVSPEMRDTSVIRLLDEAEFTALYAFLAARRAHLLLARTALEPQRRLFRPWICSLVVGALLGVAPRRALSPFRLYRSLLASGARIVKEPSSWAD